MSDEDAPVVKKKKIEDSVRDRLQTCFYAGDMKQVLHILSHEDVAFDDTYINDPIDGKRRLLIDEAGRIGNVELALKLHGLFHSPFAKRDHIITRPIYNAVKHGQIEFIDKYMRKTKNGAGEGDTNNILEAAILRNLEVVKIICERTTRKGCTSLGHNALVYACEMGYNDIARYLFSCGNLVDEYEYTSLDEMYNMHPFFVSIESGNHEMAEAFLTAGHVTFDPAHQHDHDSDCEEDPPCTTCALTCNLMHFKGSLVSFKYTLEVLKKYKIYPNGFTRFKRKECEILYLECMGRIQHFDPSYQCEQDPFIFRDRVGLVKSLLCAREKNPASPFYKYAFALDVLKVIFKMCRLFLLVDEWRK